MKHVLYDPDSEQWTVQYHINRMLADSYFDKHMIIWLLVVFCWQYWNSNSVKVAIYYSYKTGHGDLYTATPGDGHVEFLLDWQMFVVGCRLWILSELYTEIERHHLNVKSNIITYGKCYFSAVSFHWTSTKNN